MLARKSWRRGWALVIAALLLVIPASAQVPVDLDEDTASAETAESTDPTDLDSDLEEPDSEDLDEALRTDMREQASDIEEILITGEKQNTLQDAPTSSTSFNAADLQALRIEDISDLADYTPNLEINTAFAASNPTIFIRGIGLKDYNANAAGAVAVYQDGININSPAIQLGQLFDIDGIDVLRGPQGSINGRNATAGAIMIRSAMPDGEFGVSSSLTYGNYNDKEVEAAINIPLIEDMLSMRVSGTAQWRDGYTKNQCSGWDPEKYDLRKVNEDVTRTLYDDLDPETQYVRRGGEFVIDPETGEYKVRPVKWLKGRGQVPMEDVLIDGQRVTIRAVRDVYLNEPLAIGSIPGVEAAWSYTSGVGVNTEDRPLTLDETLFHPTKNYNVENGGELNPGDPNYNVRLIGFDEFDEPIYAQKGTAIATQSTILSIIDVDGICVIQTPGRLATSYGEFVEPDDPRWEESFWRKDRVQSGLEDFAKLDRFTNDIDNWAARMILLFQPLDNMEWMVNAHGTQNRGDSAHLQMLGATAKQSIPGFFEDREQGFSENSAAIRSGFRLGEGVRSVKGVVPFGTPPLENGEGGGNPYSGFYNQDGTEFIDAWGINGRGFWDLGAVVITLLYDYEWYDRFVEDEGDSNPLKVFPAEWSDSAWQTTEELRVEGEGERYKWTTGLFFLYEELTANNFFPDTQAFTINQDFSQKLTSWAPYANAEFELVEEGVIPGIYQLTLGVGLRYNQEKKEFSLSSSAIGTESLVEVNILPEDTTEKTWREWTGEVQLSYTPFFNEYGTLLSYLKYGRGFKGGHFNAGLTLKGGDAEQDIDPVEPEYIDSVEFGIRSRWLDDRVILNAAVFRYWYQDLQVFDIVNEAGQLPIQKLLNSDAEVLGAEVELRVRPLPGLLISGNGGWLDSEFGEFKVIKTILARRGTPEPFEFDYTGNPLVAAPKWNFSVVAEYEIPLFGWGSLVPQYDFNYRSKGYLDPQALDPISQEGYYIHNCRIAYRTPDERIELAFWVSNLLEEEYKIDVFDVSRDGNTILEVWGEPRTYGVTLSLNW